MKTVDVLTQIVIASPIEVVSGYASDPDNAPEWYVNLKSARWKTPKPLTVGTRVTFNAHFLGRDMEYTYEVVEYIPMQKLAMQTASGPFPMKTIYTWQSTEDGQTRMTLRNRGKPRGFSGIFAPFMSTMMKKANTKDLKKLKEILETMANQASHN